MFGYIKPAANILSEREKTLYKSAYCGLCVTGAKKLSKLSKFFLNYDIVLLSLVRMILTGESINVKVVTKRCGYKLKKVNVFEINQSQEYSVYAFFILVYYKLLDDLKDEKLLKKIPKYFIKPVVKHLFKKSDVKCPFLAEAIKNDLNRLYEKEQGSEASLDSLADSFASALGEISSYGMKDEKKELSFNIGYHIGRFVYIIDALDDLKKDESSSSFNALIAHYGSYEQAIENLEYVIETLKDSMICASNNLCQLNSENEIEKLTHNMILYGSMSSLSEVLIKYKNKVPDNE